MEGFPTQESISKVSPNNPVLLTHASGHADFANARALALAVHRQKQLPIRQGARFSGTRRAGPREFCARRRRGWSAKSWPRRAAGRSPEQIQAQARKEIELAIQECLAQGVTSFQDAGSSFATIAPAQGAG